MNPVILLPDGVGVRNFVLGPFLSHLAKECRGLILHSIPEANLPEYRCQWNGHFQWVAASPYHEHAFAAMVRYSLSFAQMYWADTQSMRHGRRARPRGSWSRCAMMRTARVFGRMLASPAGMRCLDGLHSREVERSPLMEKYRQLFLQSGITTLFCSHQRPLEILPPVLAARSLGIPTATFIFSWDNLTSKGRIAAPFDHFFVWSDLMKRELLKYYPDVRANRVHVVGTPQFDPYAEESLIWSREEFFKKIGANPSRRLICYSGGDTRTCPEDHLHVEILMELLQEGKVRSPKGKPQVLVRPAPVDDGRRYASVREKFPELIFAQPAWLHLDPGNWAQCLPTSGDVQFLSNLTRHTDVNVNLASTMTLDFAIHDRPVVNVAFDVSNPPPLGRPPLWDYYYQFDHYRPVVEMGAAKFARSRDELAKHISAYLENPALDREARRRFVELEVGIPVGQSSQKLVETLKEISA